MRSRLVLIALVVLAVPALGGCAVSLFSDSDSHGGDERLDRLEQRMDAAEKAAGVR